MDAQKILEAPLVAFPCPVTGELAEVASRGLRFQCCNIEETSHVGVGLGTIVSFGIYDGMERGYDEFIRQCGGGENAHLAPKIQAYVEGRAWVNGKAVDIDLPDGTPAPDIERFVFQQTYDFHPTGVSATTGKPLPRLDQRDKDGKLIMGQKVFDATPEFSLVVDAFHNTDGFITRGNHLAQGCWPVMIEIKDQVAPQAAVSRCVLIRAPKVARELNEKGHAVLIGHRGWAVLITKTTYEGIVESLLTAKVEHEEKLDGGAMLKISATGIFELCRLWFAFLGYPVVIKPEGKPSALKRAIMKATVIDAKVVEAKPEPEAKKPASDPPPTADKPKKGAAKKPAKKTKKGA